MNSPVFITGATGGLGKAFAVECASRGWNLFITDLQADRLETLATSLQNTYNIQVTRHACDLTDLPQRDALFERLRAEGLLFRGLINVAGVECEGPFIEQSREAIRGILHLNIESTLDVTRELLDHRDPAQTFRIITVSSLAAYYPIPSKATYSASKRFLLNFSLALNDELRQHGATVTVLCPAGLPTNPHCVASIESQGLMGALTTLNIGEVAARTIDCALRGRQVVIPGFVNQVMQVAGSLVPQVSLARFLGKRWKNTRQRKLKLARS